MRQKGVIKYKLFFFVENPSNWRKILQSLHLDSNIDFYQKFYQPLLQDRIKTIIATSWTTAVERTEKIIIEMAKPDGIPLNGKQYNCILKGIAS